MRYVVRSVLALALLAAVPASAEDAEAWRAQVRQADADIREKAAALPAGTTPCDFGAWSTDDDPKGLNVRAAPSAKAAILHRVPAPVRKSKVMREAGDPAPLRSDFRVLGFKDGWFLIDGVRAAAALERSNYETDQRASMRGWVAAPKIGGAFAYGGAPGDRLYTKPDPEADFVALANPLIGGANPRRIFACAAGWAEVETAAGQRGWFRTLCSSQIALCN